jgi:oligo-alginate lyase
VKRRILKLALSLSFLLSIAFTEGQTIYPLTGHPRLFFLASDEAVLKAKLASTSSINSVHALILSESDKMISLPVQQRILVGSRLLDVSREALRRISFLSYAYRMTRDTRYAARAETEMLAMASFIDWHPDHFLDVAEMTMAVSIGYDWLFNYLSTSSRQAIATAIKAFGIERTTGTNANQWWMTSDNNWNQVCNSGISAGVASVYDDNPSYYQTLIDRAVGSVKIPMGVYKYNGSYPEGIGYWDYGTTYNILFIDLLQRMWGTDMGLLSAEGFLNTVNFVTHMQGNGTKQLSGGALKSINPLPFNYADCGTSIGVQPGMFWLASRVTDKSILYNELQKLNFTLTNSPSGLASNRMLPFLLIWSMNLNLNNLPAPTETTYIAQGKSAMAAMRTGWGSNDIYFAIKGGTPSGNHAHMDIGSFVMETNDIRWAMDFGSSDYNNLESNGVDLWNMSQTSERWDVFRLNNLAHNTLTFNGNKQLVAGNSTVDNFVNTTDRKSVDLNLTSLYQNDVKSCIRTGAIVSSRYVEIKDVVQASSKALTVRWNLLTQAIPAKISNKIVCLTQSTKKLYLIFDGTDNVTAKAWSTRPPNTYEEQNADTYFTGFEYTIAASATQTITVKLVPEGDPLLTGIDLTASGQILNEDFESYSLSTLSSGFVSWKTNPASNGSLKAVLGEVVANPYKGGINSSSKVLKITRQDDSNYITADNASSLTYRGAQVYGYDLRVNTNSVIEFKYYKDAVGKLGVRIYDGNGNMLLVDFTDPNELNTGYSTAQWRTAQFTVGKQDLSKFSYTLSGYLLISPERNSTEAYQEKQLVLYIDDVKLLPLTAAEPGKLEKDVSFTAYYDPKADRICVMNLPVNLKKVRLYDLMGRLLQEVQVYGNTALIGNQNRPGAIYIIQVIYQNGQRKSVKVVVRN